MQTLLKMKRLENMRFQWSWTERSVWLSDDGQAYLLSQNENGEQISDVTAYFYLDEAWHSFRVAMTYGSTLNFSDIETPTDQFISDFSMKKYYPSRCPI